MKNFIWHRSSQEAHSNPYEYEAQEQFVREASLVLNAIKVEIEKYNRSFSRDDKSLLKAIWMLHIDATDSLLECLDLLISKRHKIAGRLIRDTVEVLDLAAFFHARTERSTNLLQKWYDNEVIPNREFRDYVKKNINEILAEELRSVYSQLSKINHRTYKSLAYGYILGKNDKLVYDGFIKSDILIYPGVISMYFSLLGNMIQVLSEELVKRELVSKEVVENIWKNSIEKEPVKRRFTTPEEIFRRYKEKKTTDNTVENDNAS
jgi:hypothetical protein